MTRLSRYLQRTLAAALFAGPLLALGGGSAHAQFLFFDWEGEKKTNSSGKQVVSLKTDAKPGDVIVSFGDRKLYYITKPGEAVAYPVAIPRDQDRWQGVTSVSSKRENPPWRPTSDMRKENPRLPTFVPGGHPMNPMGIRAMYLGESMYRIHGTDAPWTIGTAVSKGCIRMYNQDVLDLYPRVKLGAKVTVTWQQFKTGPGVSEVVAVVPLKENEKPGSKPVAEQSPKRKVAKVSNETARHTSDDDAPATKPAAKPRKAVKAKPDAPENKPKPAKSQDGIPI